MGYIQNIQKRSQFLLENNGYTILYEVNCNWLIKSKRTHMFSAMAENV